MPLGKSLKLLLIVAVALFLCLAYFDVRPYTGAFSAHEVDADHVGRRLVLHQALSRYCYNYSRIEAQNTCCLMQDYSPTLILQCAATNRKTSLLTSGTSGATESAATGMYWVMVGDSHIRNLFDTLVNRLASPRLKYRMASYEQNDWRDIQILFETRRKTYHGQTLYIKHLDVNMLLVYHWDPMLLRLPDLIEEWNQPRSDSNPLPYGFHSPDILVTGACLHWMKNSSRVYNTEGPLAAALKYQTYLERVRPIVENFAETTSTIFKLQDHLQIHPKNAVSNETYIDLYNSMAKWVFSEGKVNLWSSTIPLSDIYADECQKRSKTAGEITGWKCIDVKHVGHVMVEQYADMLLNDVCNPILKLPDHFC